MQVDIIPRKLRDNIKAPANKSWIIRYMIVAALNDFECKIRNINLCDDVVACMDCLDNLGSEMNCGESATVLRLLLPSVIKKYGFADFVLEGNLPNRPLGPYNDFFNISINGNHLHAEGTVKDKYEFDSEISSQFVSGLLIAGADVKGKCVSNKYAEMTRTVLNHEKPFDVIIPADETLGAYFKIGKLEIGDAENNPDMVMPWALQAAVTKGTTVISNCTRLKYKESDRFNNVSEILNLLGADVEIENDALIINGKESLQGGVIIDPHNDHRIAMMVASASQFCEDNISILNAECVCKSYPNFYDDFEKAGGKICFQ